MCESGQLCQVCATFVDDVRCATARLSAPCVFMRLSLVYGATCVSQVRTASQMCTSSARCVYPWRLNVSAMLNVLYTRLYRASSGHRI